MYAKFNYNQMPRSNSIAMVGVLKEWWLHTNLKQVIIVL